MARGIWLDRNNILDNPTRKKLYRYVSRYPGQGEREICSYTGLELERVRNHLELLSDWGYVFRDSDGGYRVSITSPARRPT